MARDYPLYIEPEEPLLAPTFNFGPDEDFDAEDEGEDDDAPLVAPSMDFDLADDDPHGAASWRGDEDGPEALVENEVDQWGYLVPDDGEGPLLPPVWHF